MKRWVGVVALLLALAVGAQAQCLPFAEDFESYTDNVTISGVGNGWSASAEPYVKPGAGVGGSKAADMPANSAVTNTSCGGAVTEVWTDLQLKPVKFEDAPDVNPDASVLAYVNSDGYLVVYDAGSASWDVCSNAVAPGATVTPIGTDWARVTFHQDYAADEVAVFVDNVLLRQGLPILGPATLYTKFSVQNAGDTNAYLDDLLVAAAPPDGLSGDSDNDFWPDAGEIATKGSITGCLPFGDDFESYADNVTIASLWYNGWTASPGAIVRAGTGVGGGKAAKVPTDEGVTNTACADTVTKVWIDMQLKPVAGDAPEVDPTASAMFYVNADGYLVVYDAGSASWVVCSESACGSPVTPIAADAWARIALHEDYAADKVAVFLNNELLREGLPIIGSATSYSSVAVANSGDAEAYLDDLAAVTAVPDYLDDDCDGDGVSDAEEIDVYNSINASVNGIPTSWFFGYGIPVDPSGNPDNDAYTNEEEYCAGTDPTDDASFFQILSIERAGSTAVVTIMGNDSGSSEPFVIERCDDLTTGFVDYDTAARGAAPANTEYTDSAATGEVLFYRAKGACEVP